MRSDQLSDAEKRTHTTPPSISSVPASGTGAQPAVTSGGDVPTELQLSTDMDGSSTRSGTKTSPRSAASRIAARRQVCKSPRLTPQRRANAETLTPGCRLSAISAAFSPVLHRRGRTTPVISSIRRYSSPSCLRGNAECRAIASAVHWHGLDADLCARDRPRSRIIYQTSSGTLAKRQDCSIDSPHGIRCRLPAARARHPDRGDR